MRKILVTSTAILLGVAGAWADDAPYEEALMGAVSTYTPQATENLLSMLEQGADPNADLHGRTALMLAANRCNAPAVELLLYAGADPQARSEHEQWTPLHFLMDNDFDYCSQCQNLPPEVLAKYEQAFKERSLRSAELLLRAGADPNACNAQGETPLSLAVRQHSHMVEYLLCHGATIPQEGTLAYKKLLEQLSRSRGCSLASLLKAGLNPNTRLENGYTLLMSLVANGHVEMVQALLQAGADVNAVSPSGQTALRCALRGRVVGRAQEERLDMVRTLLEAGATPLHESPAGNVFHAAVWGNKLPEFLLMLRACPQGMEVPDAQGRTPLMIAALSADDDMLRMLLELGANVHARDKEGYGVLAYAARSRYDGDHNRNRLQLLVEAGASLEADGPQALIVACQHGTEKSVRWLLAAGLNASATVGSSGNTLLHIATHNHNGGVVAALIEAGVAVNAKNVVGHTPLHFAMTGLNPNRWHVISVLLRAGADPYLCNNFDQTPIEWAAPDIREKLLKLLGIEPQERENRESGGQ